MILTLSYSHRRGVQQHKKLAWSLGSGGGVRNHEISITKTISRFSYQTLCVFLQIKYLKHIEQDICSDAWVMPQGWDLGAQGLTFFNMVMLHIKLTEMISKTECK